MRGGDKRERRGEEGKGKKRKGEKGVERGRGEKERERRNSAQITELMEVFALEPLQHSYIVNLYTLTWASP